jgi:hypothetical protein
VSLFTPLILDDGVEVPCTPDQAAALCARGLIFRCLECEGDNEGAVFYHPCEGKTYMDAELAIKEMA